MPIITVNILEGRDAEHKRILSANIAEAVISTLNCPTEDVRIIINEMKPENYSIAGLPVMEYRAAKKTS